MLTLEQAVDFLENILRMPPTWRELVQNDPLEFITVYLKRHAVRVPFQGIEMAAKDPAKRWFPSEEEYIAQGMTGRGGCCIHLNYFSMLVLRLIGLDSFVVRGDHYCAPVAGTHCILMVRLHGPKNFGLYLLEAGGYFPILEPVPMDTNRLPYRTLQAAGFPYEFREFAPGAIGKFHIGGGIMGGKFTDKEEILRTSWDRKPRALWEFDYPMLETFTNPPVSSLLKFPVMYRFLKNSEFRKLFPELPENQVAKVTQDLKNTLIQPTSDSTSTNSQIEDDIEDPKNFVYVWKRRIVIGDAHSRKIIKNYDNYDEMGKDLKILFPMVPVESIDKAVKVYEGFEIKFNSYDSIL